MGRDVLRARGYTYGFEGCTMCSWRGNVEGGAPVGAPGAAAFSGSWLSVHGGAPGAPRLGTGVPAAVDYLGET